MAQTSTEIAASPETVWEVLSDADLYFDGGTRIVMDETPLEGLVDTLHNRLTDEALKRRNDVALNRLKRLAEARV